MPGYDRANTAVSSTSTGQPAHQITVGRPTSVPGRLTVTYGEARCQDVLATDSTVANDVEAGTPTDGQQLAIV